MLTPSAVELTDHAAMSTPHVNVVARHAHAAAWLRLQADLGLSVRTLDSYTRGLADFLSLCEREEIEPVGAGRAEIARYVRYLVEQPSGRPGRCLDRGQPAGLANATIQQRLTVVRLFYDYLVEEGLRRTNPVGRGRYTSGKGFGGRRGLVQRLSKLPWIPTEDEWRAVLEVARSQSARNRVMFALAYDGGLRREELCSLRTDDLDPAHRTIRVRPETTKTRAGRTVPYSAPTGVLLQAYLVHRRTLSLARGPLFLSESHRNTAKPISLWTWSKVVRAIALAAGVPHFSTHTLRHLCLTDLARSGWDLHAIASFAGHRSLASTLLYIHLSGRELAGRLAESMAQFHARRVASIGAALDNPRGASAS